MSWGGGDVYEGAWAEDLPHGRGLYVYAPFGAGEDPEEDEADGADGDGASGDGVGKEGASEAGAGGRAEDSVTRGRGRAGAAGTRRPRAPDERRPHGA